MKVNPRIALPLLVMAAGLSFASGRAMAQAQPLSTLPPTITRSQNQKPLKFDGQVIAATIATITVRSRENAMLTQTFSYTPAVRDQMIRILNKGGYQFGDKVVIHYKPGTTTAIKLKGKPSKPRYF